MGTFGNKRGNMTRSTSISTRQRKRIRTEVVRADNDGLWYGFWWGVGDFFANVLDYVITMEILEGIGDLIGAIFSSIGDSNS